jgi:peptidoglycan/LPS O-acetylase OafA/YrhL
VTIKALPAIERPAPASARRNRYFDLLRAIALVRVVTYHAAGAAWLHVAFPAIGVMFGLAGSLMARSLDNRPPVRVVGSRLRRLLPPVWVYGAMAVLFGWEVLGSGGQRWVHVAFWLFPLRDPHQLAVGSGIVDTLWYLRTYLWLILLSPVLRWLFRRWPLPTLLAPLVAAGAFGLVNSGWAGRGLVANLFGYGTCWLLGFAEYEGLLAAVPPAMAIGLGAIGGLAGIGLLAVRPGPELTSDSIALGYALWSAAMVLLVLWWRPDVSWLARVPVLDRFVGAINARAVTIYLWHDPAIVAAGVLSVMVGLPLVGAARLPLALVLTAAAAVLFGWVEDLAAKRRPTLLGLPSTNPVRVGRHRRD